MVEINDRLLAKHVINQAREYGEHGQIHDTVAEGEYGQYEHDTDWSLSDMNPEQCNVEINYETLMVHGVVEAEYSVKVASSIRHPASKARPAEWERRSAPLLITIEMELGEPPLPIIHAELA